MTMVYDYILILHFILHEINVNLATIVFHFAKSVKILFSLLTKKF